MNNPHSKRPELALWPSPVGCSGWRLWQILRDRADVSEREYAAAFDRRNLLFGKWNKTHAMARAKEFIALVEADGQGRKIVVLGQEVRMVLKLPKVLLEPVELHGATWHQLPYPSGRCYWYNDEKNRALAADLLHRLYEESIR